MFKKYLKTLFSPIFPFDPPWKHQKTKGFLMFSGGSKENIGKKRVKQLRTNVPIISLFFKRNGDPDIIWKIMTEIWTQKKGRSSKFEWFNAHNYHRRMLQKKDPINDHNWRFHCSRSKKITKWMKKVFSDNI